MGFINNTSYILNAVLTKKGKQYLSKSDGKFNIVKFALSDDEIDYTLWDTAHPKGTDYYGSVLESTPMLEPCVDPEVVMKYKLITMPDGTKSLPYLSNLAPLLGDNALTTTYNDNDQNPWVLDTSEIEPQTAGGDGVFSLENYSFLVLNSNVVDIGIVDPQDLTTVNYNVGAVYGEESGRTSKKVIGRIAKIKSKIGSLGTPRETSIVITGQQSGAVYVLPVKVNYNNITPS
tara:strand:+ start:4007 stop:4702 length:696 start_codon:yes stop_codon:yes gene_type:complete